jgi:hypothetical protein
MSVERWATRAVNYTQRVLGYFPSNHVLARIFSPGRLA